MKSNSYVFRCAIIAAMGGFLFGFDTVVISGAEQTVQSLWGLNATLHGLAMSAALWGTVLGALLGGWPTDRYGRQRTLLYIGVLYLISAVGSAFSTDVWSFMMFRFIGGVGVGISTIAAPLYISEIAPPERRGRLTGLFQFNIVLGILVAFLSNALLSGIGENAWRWMLGVEAFPALIFTLLCLTIPESPRWLIGRRDNRAEAIEIFRRIQPELTAEQLDARVAEIATIAQAPVSREGFWTWRLRKPIALAFLVAFFNQLSGINAILYFAPRIFEMTGLASEAALLQSIGIGVTNLIFTYVGLRMIDKLGRRTLLYIGSFGYLVSLGTSSWAFFTGHFGIVPYCIFAFIAAHAVGQGAVIWVLISEIFPNQQRAAGQTLGSFTHWFFAAALTMAFPAMVGAFEPGVVFLFFCFMMFLQLLWVRFMVPETKGRPLEQIEKDLGMS
jgi:sugar porter (SP) family MFS transporter